jgi:CshA-type fibril repeat protein
MRHRSYDCEGDRVCAAGLCRASKSRRHAARVVPAGGGAATGFGLKPRAWTVDQCAMLARPLRARVLLAVLALTSACLLEEAKPALAASTCAAAHYALAPLQSNVFYIDTATSYLGSYVGYRATNSTGSTQSALWLRLESFSGGQVRPATGAATTSPVPLSALAGGASAPTYAYLKAAAATSSATTFDVVLYNGRPGSGGAELCRETQTMTSVQDVIKAAANKVLSASGPSSATLGGTITLTVNGSTGTIGAGIASDPGVVRFSPAVAAAWPSDSFRLVDVSHQLPLGGAAMTDILSRSNMSGPNQDYTVTYTFRVVGPTTSATPIVPVQNIASGTQVKHTDPGSFGSLAPIPLVTSATTVSVAAGGTAPYAAGATVPLTVAVANAGTGSISLDEVRATLPAGWAPTPGSWKRDAVAIADPYDSGGGTRRVTGPFTVAAGGTSTFTFNATAGAAGTSGVFSAVATLAGGQVDATTDPGDDAPAATTLHVLGAPTAADDTASAASGVARDIDVLANDDTTGASPTLAVISGPANGTANVVGGAVRYQSTGGYAGGDSFVYRITTAGGTATATVTMTVAAAPAAPSPNPESSTGTGTDQQSVTLTIPAGGAVVLLDGGLPAGSVTVAHQGTYELDSATGLLTFDPVIGFQGAATPIAFRVTDVFAQTGDSIYTPTVSPPAAPSPANRTSTGVGPAAQDVTVTIPDHGSVTLVDGGATVNTITVPGEGQYVLDPAIGLLTFTPEPAFNGTGAGVTFRAADAYGQSADATYLPTVTLPAGPTAANLTSAGVGTAPHAVVATVPAGGTVTLLGAGGGPTSTRTVAGEGTYSLDAASGTISYTPELGFAGAASGVGYRVADVYGQTATATYRPAVTPPAAPAAGPLTSTGAGASPQSKVVITPPGGAVHLVDDGGNLTDTAMVANEGLYTVSAATSTSTITFMPVPGFTGSARGVRYRVFDAYGQASEGSFAPTVTGSGDATAQPPPASAPQACVSRREITIHWVVDRATLRRVKVSVNGRVVRSLPGTARRATIDMRGRPATALQVTVVGTTTTGRRLRTARRYRTCTVRSGRPPLPTLRLR